MPTKPRLQGGKLNQAVTAIITGILDIKQVSRRELAARLDTSHTYLNNRLNGSVDFTVTDVDVIATALRVRTFFIFVAAEWAINGQRPALEGDDVDWKQIYDLAATVNPELRLPPELEQVFDKKTTSKPQLAPHEPQKIEHLFAPTPAAPKPTPLFSDRRDDGDLGNEALPRMA